MLVPQTQNNKDFNFVKASVGQFHSENLLQSKPIRRLFTAIGVGTAVKFRSDILKWLQTTG